MRKNRAGSIFVALYLMTAFIWGDFWWIGSYSECPAGGELQISLCKTEVALARAWFVAIIIVAALVSWVWTDVQITLKQHKEGKTNARRPAPPYTPPNP